MNWKNLYECPPNEDCEILIRVGSGNYRVTLLADYYASDNSYAPVDKYGLPAGRRMRIDAANSSYRYINIDEIKEG